MAIKDIQKELRELKAREEEIKAQLDEARKERILNLHEELAFDSPTELVEAIRESHGLRVQRRKGGRRIPTEVRAEIEYDLKAGDTGTSIARKYGVSTPTVHNIKKDLGLVKPRR